MLYKKFILIILSLSMIFGSILFSATADSKPINNGTRVKKGDVNCDGYFKSNDARLAFRAAAGLEPKLSKIAVWAGDIDGDGKVSASDGRQVLRIAAKLSPEPNIYYDDYILIFPQEPSTNKEPNTNKEPSQPYFDTSYCSAIIPPTDINNKNFPLPSFPTYDKTQGTFAFTTFGYGHGVGMSQCGAIYLSDSCGYNYKQILNYYYKNTRMMHDEVPKTLFVPNEGDVDTREILGRIAQQEINGYSPGIEALKAQVVAAYTYSLHNRGSVSGLAYSNSASSVKDIVWAAVDAVWGEYLVDANASPINALFFALSAGRTTSASTVWGGSNLFELVDSPFDRIWSKSYKQIATSVFTVDEIRVFAEKFNAKVRAGNIKYCGEIVLQENPGEWFKVLETDAAVNSEIGYVTKMQIGNQVLNSCAGQRLRADFFEYKIRSHCFIIEYFGKDSNTNIQG